MIHVSDAERARIAENRVAKLEAMAVRMHEFAELVWDHLVPIVEMSDEANDPSEDLYIVMHQIKTYRDEGFSDSVGDNQGDRE